MPMCPTTDSCHCVCVCICVCECRLAPALIHSHQTLSKLLLFGIYCSHGFENLRMGCVCVCAIRSHIPATTHETSFCVAHWRRYSNKENVIIIAIVVHRCLRYSFTEYKAIWRYSKLDCPVAIRSSAASSRNSTHYWHSTVENTTIQLQMAFFSIIFSPT